MGRSLVLFMLCLFGVFTQADATAPKKKILVLIIASDNQPVYVHLQQVWRAYMHLDRRHVEAYFIKGDPNLDASYRINKDVIWSKTEESVAPGITNKTVLSLECLYSKLNRFDYVVRTNLSSFYIFPRLLQFLETQPKKNYYGGVVGHYTVPYISGAGILMSTDMAKMLVRHKQELMHVGQWDDVLIGEFFSRQGIETVAAPRLDVETLEAWSKIKDDISKETFHIRAKNLHDKRSTDEVKVQLELLKKFYKLELNLDTR